MRRKHTEDVVVLSLPDEVRTTVQRHNDLFCITAHGDGVILDSIEARKLRDYLNEQKL